MRRRRSLGGVYVPDWGSAPGYGVRPVGPPPPPVHPGAPGRNLAAAEAIAQDMAQRLTTVAEVPTVAELPRVAEGGTIADAIRDAQIGDKPFAVRRQPWLDLPSAGEPYIFMNGATVLVPAIGFIALVVTFQVPRRRNGNIEWVANQFIGGQGVEGTGVIQWRILLDGIPAKGYNNIPATIGTMSGPADLRESPIRIFENQIVDLVLFNVSFNPNQQVLLGLLRGKFWPLEQEGQSTWV